MLKTSAFDQIVDWILKLIFQEKQWKLLDKIELSLDSCVHEQPKGKEQSEARMSA